MWRWPKRLFLLSLVLFFAGMFLGYASDDPNGESGIAAVGQAIAITMVLVSFVAIALTVLMAFAALFNQPGEPRHWVWRGRFSILAFLGWLGVCFVIWIAAHTGGGGLDGPCFGEWASDRGGPNSCKDSIADWPPLSTKAVVDAPEGHFERLYPSTVGLITIISIALLPLVLWPLARWLTREERSGPAPLRPLAWLVGSAVGISLVFSVLVDEDDSRPLNSVERAELRADEVAANTPRVPAVPPVKQYPSIDPTAVDPVGVANLVSDAREASERGPTTCAPGTETGVGLWTCTTTTPDSSVLTARVTINGDGSWAGVYVDRRGLQHPLRGCCVPVAATGTG